MALTKYREPNQVKWVGTRPGHNGTQVVKNWYTANASNTFYTVPANKLFLFNQYHVSCSNNAAAVGIGYVTLYTDAAAVFYRLYFVDFLSNGALVSNGSFPIPMELPVGYYFTAVSNRAAVILAGAIHGFEIDV